MLQNQWLERPPFLHWITFASCQKPLGHLVRICFWVLCSPLTYVSNPPLKYHTVFIATAVYVLKSHTIISFIWFFYLKNDFSYSSSIAFPQKLENKQPRVSHLPCCRHRIGTTGPESGNFSTATTGATWPKSWAYGVKSDPKACLPLRPLPWLPLSCCATVGTELR